MSILFSLFLEKNSQSFEKVPASFQKSVDGDHKLEIVSKTRDIQLLASTKGEVSGLSAEYVTVES